MPRCARIKSSDSIYHIMVRSISDVDLYRTNQDKDKYLSLIKKYQVLYAFKVYAYCIMDTHAHLIIDSAGADISRIMHAINQSYAQYYNKEHSRRGHLFQDRFKSKIVEDERYLITLSGYIHNNPSDLPDYSKRIKDYEYSSLGIYLGSAIDTQGIVDPSFILQLFSRKKNIARQGYLQFVSNCSEEKLKEDSEFTDPNCEYRSERRIIGRDRSPRDVIDFVSGYTKQEKAPINVKYTRDGLHMKALSVLVMRSICGMYIRDICSYMGNVSQSHVSRLCSIGIRLVMDRSEYKNILMDFIESLAA
jgi:REP element-mobilizing transposase RayT